MDWGIDTRELRDYYHFKHPGDLPEIEAIHQAIINTAYEKYCRDNGDVNFRVHLKEVSEYYGMTGRHVIEQWEINPNFYPYGYDTK